MIQTTKRPRFRIRYGLRTFFVLFTLSCLISFCWIKPSIEQQRDVRSISQWNLGVGYGAPPKWVPSWCVRILGADFFCRVNRVGSRNIECGNWRESVTCLDLPDRVSTEEIPNLLPKLNTVWLGRKTKTDFLTRLDHLKVLQIRYGQADEVPKLPQLDTLMIDGRDGEVVDCELLPERFPNLTALMISTDVKNIEALVRFSGLKTLKLGSYGRRPGALDLTPIGELETLERLTILCDEITDLSPLASLSDLETLELMWSDRVRHPPELTPLHTLRKLRNLRFNNSCYTDQHLYELRRICLSNAQSR